MKKFFLPMIFALGLLAVSCNNDSDGGNEDNGTPIEVVNPEQTRINTERNGEIIGGVKDGDEPPAGFYEDNNSSFKSRAMDEEVVNTLPLEFIANVETPDVDGNSTQATHVTYDEDLNYLYVAYNTIGDVYAGGIDIIDLNDPKNPIMLASSVFSGVDISSVKVSGSTLYAVGASDVDAFSAAFAESLGFELASPALLIRIPLVGGSFNGEAYFTDITSFVGKDVAVGNNNYFTISGDNGGLEGYDLSTNEQVYSIPISDTRSIGVTSTQAVVLSGENISIYNQDGSEAATLPVNMDNAEGAQRTLDFYGENILVSLGLNGMSAYSFDGTVITELFNVPVNTNDFTDAGDQVVNAVSTLDDHILLAEGSAGLVILGVNNQDIADLDNMGSLALEGSANYVSSAKNYVFVASGTDGLNILHAVSDTEDGGSGGTTDLCGKYELVPYTGTDPWLNINSGEDQYYTGSAQFAGINIGAEFVWYGTIATTNDVQVNSTGHFILCGTLFTNKSLMINSLMETSGALTISRDLTLNSGGELSLFNGSAASVGYNLTMNSNSVLNIEDDNTTVNVTDDFILQGGTINVEGSNVTIIMNNFQLENGTINVNAPGLSIQAASVSGNGQANNSINYEGDYADDWTDVNGNIK